MLLHHSSFSTLPPNKSLLPASPHSPFAVILLICQVQPTRCCPLRFAAQLRRTSTPYLLNLHRARVRRNRGRLPSSRCIESAPEHHALILILLLMRASDTSLGLPGTNLAVAGPDYFRLADKLANVGFDFNSEIWSLPIPLLVKPGKEFIPSGHRAGRGIRFRPDGLL